MTISLLKSYSTYHIVIVMTMWIDTRRLHSICISFLRIFASFHRLISKITYFYASKIYSRIAQNLYIERNSSFYYCGWLLTPSPPVLLQMISCSTRILVLPVLPFISIDGPFPGRVAETIVGVNILDMNDHAPTLFQTHYSAYVFENAAVNSTILTVYASDLDKVGKKIFIIYLRELREKLCS